ncbi:hypothetical protein M011DRAFT_396767 [Sporormia fimetaria CBS 119925]|uniref:Uncharacterized protein n=1 Tax=Sporormia fimetaria CBS 119925 TaxID=1340428 RepID=A0A6A6VIP1_9PLEO|nr:hypothetical protein M011DRAFT_396767 [Sporormia fimetaria CBS 119925]
MAPQAPPRANVLSAADYVRKLFEIKGLNWAAMGGLSVLWYGHQRELFDISVVYDLHNFQRIKDLLQEERRVKCPKDMNNLSATRVLITTGPFYNDPHCSQDADVEFNLIPSGK